MTFERSLTFAFAAASIALLGAIEPTPVLGQIPDTFTNLELLDKDTSRQKIVGIMRDWAGGLGVRCNHCHVGPDNLVGMDFASDEKPTKRTARRMLEMARTINRTQLADLPSTDGERAQMVSCFTCHRGQPKPPRNIGIVLGEMARDRGVDAALDEFRRLRDEFDNHGLYDLRPRSLIRLAQPLAARGRFDDAIKVLETGLAIDPGVTDLIVGLALAHAGNGAPDTAKAILEKALEADPANESLARSLARMIAAEETEAE